MTQPSQSALSKQRVGLHTGRIAQYRASALDTLSCHGMLRIRRMLLMWSVDLLSILSCQADADDILLSFQCVGNAGIVDCHILSSPKTQVDQLQVPAEIAPPEAESCNPGVTPSRVPTRSSATRHHGKFHPPNASTTNVLCSSTRDSETRDTSKVG